MKHVGIDLSASRVAVVTLGNPPSVTFLDEGKRRASDPLYVRAADHGARIRRARRLAETVYNALADYGAAVIAIESYEALRGRAGYATAELFGLVLSAIEQNDAWRWFLVHPDHVKMFVGLGPHASKSEVIYQVRQRWGFEHPFDDAVDAYVLARMAELAADPEHTPSTRFQTDVLERSFVLNGKRKNLQFRWKEATV